MTTATAVRGGKLARFREIRSTVIAIVLSPPVRGNEYLIAWTSFPSGLLAGLGVGELQEYLEDPMSHPDVRRDEETRATTVEHVKLLRNRLEATTKEHINELSSYLVRVPEDGYWHGGYAAAATEGDRGRASRNRPRPSDLEHAFNARLSELDRELDRRAVKLEERMEAIVDKRLGDLARKLDMVLRTSAD